MKTIRMLIIDDEVVDRAYYARVLKQSSDTHYEIIEASNAKDGLMECEKGNIDCILLDYQLPDMNGICVLQQIKKLYDKAMPVIILTGRGDESTAVNAMKAGATDYIIKNKIDPIILIKTITNAVRNAQLKKIIKQQKQQLQYYAYYDHLTGLANRHTFEEMISHLTMDAKKFHYSLAVLVIDIDNFTTINDSFGYLTGDELLIQLSKRLSDLCSDEMIIARLGDDEFAVLVTGSDVIDSSGFIAKKIIHELSMPFQLGIDTVNIKTSIGIAHFPDTISEPTDLLKNASLALSQAKEAGGGTFHFYAEGINKIYYQNLKLEKIFHDDLNQNKNFFVNYQPIFELNNNKPAGIEISLSWFQSSLGLLLYDKLIPLIEKNDLNIIYHHLFLQIVTDQLLKLPPFNYRTCPLILEMNLSLQQFKNPLIIRALEDLIIKTHLDPSWIKLQISETHLLAYLEDSSISSDLHGMSIQFTVSDFKIGTTALEKLAALPVTSFKVPFFYLHASESKKYFFAMLKSIITIGKELNCAVIVDGVENENHIKLLKTLDCSFAEGNYFLKPLNLNELADFINHHPVSKV